ncbi:MAG: 3-hydroxyacyl-CoA dehydrogenase family protein, partial [Vicinamibacterales bacterium]
MSDRIAVIGAGQMGNGIAHVFAQSGFPVTMIDVSPEALTRGRDTIAANLDRQIKKGTIDAAAKAATLGRVATSSDFAAVADATVVIEAATESAPLKFKVFADLDRLTPESTILASNTSSISISEIAAKTRRPELVIGMHFMNPVPVMQLVEIIRGLATSDTTTAKVVELARQLGKTPVEVNDYPGFVANRILMPMINEAIYCVMEGVASAEAIDNVMK